MTAAIDQILKYATEQRASDIHIKSGQRPRLRIAGRLEPCAGFRELGPEDVRRVTTEIMSEEQRESFEQGYEIDFSYTTEFGRFRCACFRDRCGPGAVYRAIPSKIATVHELNLPPEVAQFAHLHRGLMLVTGSSGSGKSATLAALINIINERYQKHIITLEDPIEYVHEDHLGIVHQRGLHDHFESFGDGIIQAMRQDPDVLVIGELRDQESIRRALTAAETGIVVFGTLHTNGAAETLDRLIDAFPAQEQDQVRVQLSESLAGVISQVLLNRIDVSGRIPATEILVATSAVANIIREGKSQDIANVIQSGRSLGMRTMDDSLLEMVRAQQIESSEAWIYARNKGRFDDSPYSGAALRTRQPRVPV